MKKLLFTLFLCAPFLAHAQWTTTGSVTSTTNNVGIGTTTPAGKLDVNGALALSGQIVSEVKTIPAAADGTIVLASGAQLKGYYTLSFVASNRTQTVNVLVNGTQFDPNSSLSVLTNTSYSGQAVMSNFRLVFNADQSVIYLVTDVANRNSGTSIIANFNGTGSFGPGWGGTLPGSPSSFQAVTPIGVSGGNVGIGTLNPGSYRLAVNGSVHAKQVNVDLTGWADYVFRNDYELPALEKVEAFIRKNRHLPEVPSEKEIGQGGLNLGEMVKLQMKKIEELTLYLIEKDKELKAQRRANRKLNARVSALETRKK